MGTDLRFYDQQRTADDTHHRAGHTVGNRLIGILASVAITSAFIRPLGPPTGPFLCLVLVGTHYRRCMVRPESWTRLAGGSPVRVGAGAPGSRPRFVVERWRAERGVKSLFGGSKRAGRSATRCESCSLVRLTMGEPSRSCRGEGHVRRYWCSRPSAVGSLRGMGSGTYAQSCSEQERPVCAASSAKTAWISRW